jgi:beta-mannosidase
MLWSQQQDIEVAALKSKSYLTIPIDQLMTGKDPKSVFLFAELLVGGKPVSRNEHFFLPYKNLLLPRPQISAEAVRTRAGFRITLSSDKLARAVYLSAPDYTGFFVDNYFDLIPGRKVEVEFRTGGAANLADFQKRLTIRYFLMLFRLCPQHAIH